MSENLPVYALADENGLIRYDWPSIQLLWTAGASAADIAKSITKDCPESYFTARNTIAVRALRHEWKQTADDARKLVSGHPNAKFAGSRDVKSLSSDVIATAQNIAVERKNNYLNGMSEFGDKTINLLKAMHISDIDIASETALKLEPVHRIMKDIHGLNAREPVAALQVNVLSAPGGFAVVQDEPESVVETDNIGG